MPASAKRTVSLPTEQSGYIDSLIATGAYASASEVVRAGLRALQEREGAIGRWLTEDVAPAYDRMRADPSRGIPAEEVFASIRSYHAEQIELNKRAP